MNNVFTREKEYLEIFLEPVRKCKTYLPKFGKCGNEKGLELAEFKILYSQDVFYSWIGLDFALMYAAHRAVGGMTSIYRQIGIGCELLFRAILTDTTGYVDPVFATWSYTTKTRSGDTKILYLDGRLELAAIKV